MNIELVTRRFWSAMHRVMFGRRDDLEIMRIGTLHPLNKRDCQAARKIWIFAVRCLTASPARVAKYIDVGRPECESVIAAMVVVAKGFVVFRTGLRGNDVRNAMHQVRIPGGGDPDGLREHCG